MRLRLLLLGVLLAALPLASHGQSPGWGDEGWQRNGMAALRFDLQGTGNRNNPLRRRLAEPFSGDELFVRYRLRYDAETIDTPTTGDGEFFVLWLDRSEGSDASTHSQGVPNVGLHVMEQQNRFMIRFDSGQQRFGPELQGDRDYLVVARLLKSVPGKAAAFDQLSLWVDPDPEAEDQPQASVANRRSLSELRWIGFSTGSKTEFNDHIQVWDIDVAESWREILDLPPASPREAPLAPEPAARTVDFTADVQPILQTHCFGCHAGEDNEAGLRLDVFDEVLNQTAPRDAEGSRLIEVIREGEMPPDGETLSDLERGTLKTWINEGLAWDADQYPTPPPVTDHWAFQPIQRPEVPPVARRDWVRTPVDHFIARRHAAFGLEPAPEATASTLRRRLTLDLHATVLHALGIDAERLTFDHHGLQETPLGVSGGSAVMDAFRRG